MEMVLCGSDFEVPLNEQRDIKSDVGFGDVIIFRTMVSLMTSQLRSRDSAILLTEGLDSASLRCFS